MIVPGEIANRYIVDARLFLLFPMARAQLAAYRQQLLLSAVACPVAFLSFFQLTAQANTGKAKRMVQNGH